MRKVPRSRSNPRAQDDASFGRPWFYLGTNRQPNNNSALRGCVRLLGGARLAAAAPPAGRSQCFPDPTDEIVPSKEPVVVPVVVSYQRSQTKLPDAPAKRPVPPWMTAFSTM